MPCKNGVCSLERNNMPRNKHKHRSTGTKIKEALLGAPGKINQLPSAYTPQQQNVQNTGLQQLLDLLKQNGLFGQQQQQGGMPALGGLQGTYQGGYNSGGGDFAPVAQHAMSQFASDTVPGLAERFTQLGGGGTQLGSSAFQGALGSAGAGLQESLASMGSQYGLQQRGLDQQQQGLGLQQQGQNQTHLINLLRSLLNPQNDYAYTPGRQGFLPSLGQGAGALGSSLLGRFF